MSDEIQSMKLMSRDELLARGRDICEAMPIEQQPIWFAKILKAASQLRSPIIEIESVVRAADNKELWVSCRQLFLSVRQLTLAAEESPETDSVTIGLLYLAENVAKVSFNASGETPQFDSDAGHWIPVCLAAIVQDLEDSVVGRFDALIFNLSDQASHS